MRRKMELNSKVCLPSPAGAYIKQFYKGDIPTSQKGNKERLMTPHPRESHHSTSVSPKLVSEHFAGCKFSEPPSPSALPLPPQHWVQTKVLLRPYTSGIHRHQDFSQQLKLLLKVQA